MQGKRILLVIGGGIAAYKALELIRLITASGGTVTPVLTKAAEQFVTPMSVAALAGHAPHTDLFDLTAEAEIGHIQLSRSADLVVVAPATADLMAKMVQGRADDLASTLLLATDKKVLIAPAMNVKMWHHPATQRNLAQLRADGVAVIGPNEGGMACGEFGLGRMSEPAEIVDAIAAAFGDGPLRGKHVLITSGPTHEPIDPVRYIANRSSGAQGAAIAQSCRDLGARVSFVTGPATVPPPDGVEVQSVQTAAEMLSAVQHCLPADAAIFTAAVADWRVSSASETKIKKEGGELPRLVLEENPDILAHIGKLPPSQRPQLVVGFAAETHDVERHAAAKRIRKGADWILANDVRPETGIMGGVENAVTFITADAQEAWPRMSKLDVGATLAARIAEALA